MESYIVVISRVMGARTVERKSLRVPLAAATGNLERLSDLQIRDIQKDLAHEAARRTEAQRNRKAIAKATNGWSPFDALRS